MHPRLHFNIVVLLAMAVLGCQSPNSTGDASICRVGDFVIDGSFENARLGNCTALSENKALLINSPEDTPINHSPWYAFKISQGKGRLILKMRYTIHKHRYWPKISYNGIDWMRLDESQVSQAEDGSVMIDLQIDQTPVWLAGQELLTQKWYADWLDWLDKRQGIKSRVLGQSIAGRDIVAFETNPVAVQTVVLVGRQHPPEITGALAMKAFVDQVLESRVLACALNESADCHFFHDTNFLVVPLLNPDGVAEGHWRHGLGHLDLNRDWGPFTQPETQAVQKELDRLDRLNKRVVLFIDFHSTVRNLFYTQSAAEERAMHNDFSTRWLTLAKSKKIYAFKQQRRHNIGLPTAKSYMFERYKIPSITYEVGDETNRSSINKAAAVLANLMLKLLSETNEN